MSKHHPEMDKISSGALFPLLAGGASRNLSSAVPRRAASFQVGVGCPQRFCSEISLRESSVYGRQADSVLSWIFQQPPHHQTGNYISQNLLPCRVCGIGVCPRGELWEGRSEAEATSLRPPPKSRSDAAASGSHTLVWTYAGLQRPLSAPARSPALSSVKSAESLTLLTPLQVFTAQLQHSEIGRSQTLAWRHDLEGPSVVIFTKFSTRGNGILYIYIFFFFLLREV